MFFNTFCTLILITVIATKDASADFYNPNCTASGTSCLDCNTQKWCNGNVLWSKSSCLSNSPGYKNFYCNPANGFCTNVPYPGCQVVGVFKCLRPDGLFPDITNCTNYFNCKNGTAEKLSCPQYFVYQQSLGKCVVKLDQANCTQVTCGLKDTELLYIGDSSLYIQCTSGFPMLKSCPVNTMYNLKLRKCETICQATNDLPNNQNCSEFISCNVTGSGSTLTVKSCPTGYGFNPTTGQCQPKYDELCYEISIVANDLNKILSILPSFVQDIVKFVVQFLPSLIGTVINFGVPKEYVSSGMLVIDYIITVKKLPAIVVDLCISLMILLVPEPYKIWVKFTVDNFVSVINVLLSQFLSSITNISNVILNRNTENVYRYINNINTVQSMNDLTASKRTDNVVAFLTSLTEVVENPVLFKQSLADVIDAIFNFINSATDRRLSDILETVKFVGYGLVDKMFSNVN